MYGAGGSSIRVSSRIKMTFLSGTVSLVEANPKAKSLLRLMVDYWRPDTASVYRAGVFAEMIDRARRLLGPVDSRGAPTVMALPGPCLTWQDYFRVHGDTALIPPEVQWEAPFGERGLWVCTQVGAPETGDGDYMERGSILTKAIIDLGIMRYGDVKPHAEDLRPNRDARYLSG